MTETTTTPTETLAEAETLAEHQGAPDPRHQTATTTRPTATLVPLAPEHLACRSCGQAAGTTLAETVQLPGTVLADHYYQGPSLGLGVCTRCAVLEDRARDLVRQHPAASAAFGPGGVLPRALAVVAAHEILGRPLPAATIDDAEFSTLIRLFGWVSVWRWVAALDRGKMGQCAAEPWSHVPAKARSTLRERFATLVAERHAATLPPERIAPPAPTAEAVRRAEMGGAVGAHAVPGGCLMCGRAALELAALQVLQEGGAREAAAKHWHPLALGRTVGHVCDACHQAVQLDGAVGPSATELALVQACRLGSRYPVGEVALEGITPWAELADRGAAPNLEPWAHLGSLAELTSALADSLGIITVEVR
ncbi:hypothetical protein ACTQ49_11735 [Luteococcus sp. Sow4_B9]|uniref:hypothetical protein n=1 Tax=Luteococcus sp. Sow4_B9 TaxID=3438792 RepID=UPI003F9801BE